MQEQEEIIRSDTVSSTWHTGRWLVIQRPHNIIDKVNVIYIEHAVSVPDALFQASQHLDHNYLKYQVARAEPLVPRKVYKL